MKHLKNYSNYNKINEISAELKDLAASKADYLLKKAKDPLTIKKRQKQKEFFDKHTSPISNSLTKRFCESIEREYKNPDDNLSLKDIKYELIKQKDKIVLIITEPKIGELVNITIDKNTYSDDLIHKIISDKENLSRKLEKLIIRIRDLELSKGKAYGYIRSEYNKLFNYDYSRRN